MKRVVAGAHLPTPWLFEKRADNRAWAAVSFASANTWYSFSQLSGQWSVAGIVSSNTPFPSLDHFLSL